VPFSMTFNDLNPGFKVTVFFIGEYLTNGVYYGQSFYRTLIISNLMNGTSCDDLEWLWIQIFEISMSKTTKGTSIATRVHQ